MQIRNSAIGLLAGLACFMHDSPAVAQTTHIPLWAKENWFLERLEIKAQRDNDLNLSTVKPYMRKAYVAVADSFRQMLLMNNNPANLSKVDQYNLDRFQANNSEYSRYSASDFNQWRGKAGAGSAIFPTRSNMVEVKQDGFFMAINPVAAFQQGFESDSEVSPHHYALGATGRGLIGKHVGFQFFVTGNREQGPLQFRRFVDEHQAVPGAVFYNTADENKAYTYLDARGSISTHVTKYINVQFGYDQQFVGSGYRSLYLSNFSGSHLFLKLNTRIWRLNYTNYFMQLSPTGSRDLNDLYQKKYASMHHLSINATRWLNIGLFESVIFGRQDHYDYSYLQPVIFLRSIEQQNGSPDNANIGLDVKANVGKTAQIYGQLMLDEFLKDEVVGGRYWWGNKQAFQLGAKYVDAFGLRNLDIQAEYNHIRPFMGQFRDTTGSYTHASQSLAHPMGANLKEMVGIIRYQPSNRLYLTAKVNVWAQGLDSAGYNFGANPNELYLSVSQGGKRLRDDNYPMLSGMRADGLHASFTASYELLENMFVDVHAMYRSYEEVDKPKSNTTMLSVGFRWNMMRKEYDY